MKKVLLKALCLLVILSSAIFSCNKSQESNVTKKIDLTSKSDNTKISIVSNDADWRFIASQNQEIISKFVNSNIDVANFNFDDEKEFLKVIGISKEKYLSNAVKVKAAANRLATKYDLVSQDQSAECISCETDKQGKYAKLKRTINLFKENKVAFQNFQSLLISPNYVIPEDGGDDGDGCCKWRFYACVTLCAATIEVFPAYLLCCAFCYDTYCCK